MTHRVRYDQLPLSRFLQVKKKEKRRVANESLQSGDDKDKEKDRDKKDDDTKTKGRYRSVVRKWNKKQESYEDVDVDLDGKKVEDGEIAFTFRKKILSTEPGDPRDTTSEVDIEAAGLRSLVRDIVGTDYPGQNMDGDTVNITAPYAPLVRIAL